MPRIAGLEEIKKAIIGLERETGLPNDRLNHRQDVTMSRESFYKLTIISFLEGKGRATLSRNTVDEYIENYEKENGSLKRIARNILDSGNEEEIIEIIKLKKNKPITRIKRMLENL